MIESEKDVGTRAEVADMGRQYILKRLMGLESKPSGCCSPRGPKFGCQHPQQVTTTACN